MPSVQIKNVPPEVHTVWRRRAIAAGMSLQEYLLQHLTEEASQETLDEVLNRVSHRSAGSVPFRLAADTVRVERDRR
jgi:hypothetical protein